jgi:pimeloyl-ACP methyl ester carboxylesterase
MHYVLVHGAYHGAWCWDELRKELHAAGHTTTAMDLPSEDPEAGAERYAAAVTAAIPEGVKDVVLVGHSMAGLTIPLVAAAGGAVGTVYLAAILPVPGSSFDGQHADIDTGFTPSQRPHSNPDGSASWPEAGAIETFYPDCPPEIASAAARRLRRQHWRVTREVTPLKAWPAVPAAYIVCQEDRAVSADYGRQAARSLLNVEALEMPGGHSPFLSRPRMLAEVLSGLFVAGPGQTS